MTVHCVLGARVNAPWALAIARRLSERYGVDGQVMPSDDGIVVRLPDTAEEPPGAELVAFDPEEIAQLVEESVGTSALFASRFRECAARSLLLPRRDPRRRQPLWQQRQRVGAAARRGPRVRRLPGDPGGRPRVPAGRLRPARAGRPDARDRRPQGAPGRGRDAEARRRSPARCSSATSARSSTRATRRWPSAGPPPWPSTPPCSASCSAGSTCASCSTRRWSPRPRRSCSGSPRSARPATPRTRPSCCACWATCPRRRCRARASTRPGWPRWSPTRRAIRVRIAGEERWIGVEDAGRYRDALGVALPVGVAEAYLEPVADPLGDLVARYARTHGRSRRPPARPASGSASSSSSRR